MNNDDKITGYFSDSMDTISLDELEEVKFMNRIDYKFVAPLQILENTIPYIRKHYYILEIEEIINFPYHTIYYDTPDNEMYIEHHNGKLNRYKIRKRAYVASGVTFLEVKFKNNKGRTIKHRIHSEDLSDNFTSIENHFISENSPYNNSALHHALINKFHRITLVSKTMTERCTMDTQLFFGAADKKVLLCGLLIIEVKTKGRSSFSPMTALLRENHILPTGFSKYCIGRTVTEPKLKHNAFKGKIRRIQKIVEGTELTNKAI